MFSFEEGRAKEKAKQCKYHFPQYLPTSDAGKQYTELLYYEESSWTKIKELIYAKKKIASKRKDEQCGKKKKQKNREREYFLKLFGRTQV